LVRDDGDEFYAELETPETLRHEPVSQWVKHNVYPQLDGKTSTFWSRRAAADHIKGFVEDKPEFWAYVADYDWVALSQLYGPLVNRPANWPLTALDVYQLPDFTKYVVKPDKPHHALSDARALKASFLAWEKAQHGTL
jgi:hypothetical protein